MRLGPTGEPGEHPPIDTLRVQPDLPPLPDLRALYRLRFGCEKFHISDPRYFRDLEELERSRALFDAKLKELRRSDPGLLYQDGALEVLGLGRLTTDVVGLQRPQGFTDLLQLHPSRIHPSPIPYRESMFSGWVGYGGYGVRCRGSKVRSVRSHVPVPVAEFRTA